MSSFPQFQLSKELTIKSVETLEFDTNQPTDDGKHSFSELINQVFQMNVREHRRDNQEWTIQKHRQHRTQAAVEDKQDNNNNKIHRKQK